MRPAQDTIARQHLGHVPALDGIRAAAALAVVGFHAHIPGFTHGGIGVDVFFVLSGFLITTILIPAPGARTSLHGFYRRRALRLLPAYYAVVVVCVIAELFADHGATYKAAAASSVYAANWVIGVADTGGGGTLTHMWSLSIEEQFYLAWPLMLAFLLRRAHWNGRTVLLAVAGLAAASWALTVCVALAGAPARVAQNATPTRAVELFAGAALAVIIATPSLVALLERQLPPRRAGLAGLAAGVLLLTLAAFRVPGMSDSLGNVVMWPAISALTCLVIYACLRNAGPLTPMLGSRPMAAIGKRSYGLYLWHFPILVIIDAQWGLDAWPARLGGLAVSAVVVTLSYRFIERPFLARKDRPRRSPDGYGFTPILVLSDATPVPLDPPVSA